MTTADDNGCEAPASKLLSVLNTCRDCRSIKDFKEFVRTRLREVLPHQIAMCGLCDTRSRRILRLINIDFPLGYLRQVIRPDQLVLGGPLREWLCERSPTVIHIGQNPSRACSADRDYGISSFSCHGVIDLSGTVSSYFAFARFDHRIVPFERELLGFVVPHLHEAIAKLLTTGYVASGNSAGEEWSALHPLELQDCAPLRIDITQREREVLQWIAAGKSNWEIGKILHISEFTVKNHVQNLLKALGVTSRAHAATKAMSSGMIATSDFPPLARARLAKRAARQASLVPSTGESRGQGQGAGYLRGGAREPRSAAPRPLR